MLARKTTSGSSGTSSIGTAPQASPASFVTEDGGSGSLKVDRVLRVCGRTLVAGWCTESTELALVSAGEVSGTQFRTERHDVAAHFGRPVSDKMGFVLIGPAGHDPVELVCGGGRGRTAYPLAVEAADELDANASALLMPALVWLASEVEPFSDAWVRLISLIPGVDGSSDHVAGAFDEAVASAGVQRGRASGWIAAPEDSPVWLQDSHGGVHSLAGAFRVHRDDVREVLAKSLASPVRHRPGFSIGLVSVSPGTTLQLKVLDGDAVRQLAQITVKPMSVEPVEASRYLLASNGTPTSRLAERFSVVEGPILDELIRADRARWKDIPVRVRAIGKQVEQPLASIIIPLYGRADFVEHQLIEFSRDQWLVDHVEINYVVDDRALVDRFVADAQHLHGLYRVPFRIIWGGINRGFAGANNLGADQAGAPYLLFVNSDVFPRAPGWVQAMLQVLDEDPAVGVVAPRLLFADGSIQHAGMEFQRREDLGIWINHHPKMGLDPSLDQRPGVTNVPAVTGACMALRRSDYDQVGGWDTGFLIGDFEDSDLCLKLRQAGLSSAYLPSVELTHLERQSFRLLGEGDYRTKVVIYNALRHQQRWQGLLTDEQGATA